MSDEDDVVELGFVPNKAEAEQLVSRFAELTGTDTACAQYFLQDRDWDLERSVNAYYTAKSTGGVHVLTDGDEPQIVFNITKEVASFLESATTKPPSEFRLVSWNIDGLDEQNLKMRTKAVVRTLQSLSPDVVFLQEVVPKTLDYIQKNMPPQYKFISGGSDGYFTATLVNICTVYYDGHRLIDFQNSTMGRNLLCVDAHIGKVKLALMNTHMESTRDHAGERINQLKICFKQMQEVQQDVNVIMGGDLNLRDKELDSVGGLPHGIEDTWVSCGARKECEYTWDLLRNNNKQIPGLYKPRLRFDRVYLRRGHPRNTQAKFFGLTGLQRISGYQCFPSDHWGLLVDFDILS